MGNQMSVPQRVEEQENESEADTHIHKVTWDGDCDQNGVGVILSTHTVQHYDEVDLGIGIREDKAAASPREAQEVDAVAGAGGKNLGQAAKPQAPAAKSRFFLMLSRPVPGRPGDQGWDSSAAAAGLDVSAGPAPADKGPSEHMALPGPAVPGLGADKTPGRPPAGDQAAPATCSPAPRPPQPEAGAPAKPLDASIFHKFFTLDKGGDTAPGGHQGPAKRAERREQAGETARPPGPADSRPATEETGDSKETEGRGVETVSGSGPGNPEDLEIPKEDCQTTQTGENSSIMSFFKTLVSPNKAETKKDPEDKAPKAESLCDGQAGQMTSESQAKGSKKKHLDSPRLALHFRKFFRHKGSEMPPTPTANLKSDKSNITSQEPQVTAKSPKGCNAPGHGPSVTSSDTPKEGGKEKPGPGSLPLGKLFWKKSVKEESVSTGAEENVVCDSAVETVRCEKVECTLQTVDLTEGEAAPAPTQAKLQEEESQPRRSSLMAFLRQMSVRGDGGTTRSGEPDGKDSGCHTSNSTEKATTPPEPEPTGTAQQGKEGSSKEKKPAPEGSKPKSGKQEAREPAQCAQQARVDSNSLQNGDKPQKRPEKRRQSLGGFLKGLGPKRMLDAQVQTDPVSIGPVGKAK
ncbi:breast carcinoma-amplified sequence 1 [Dipodomys spectabilis]|uniref:breast carcinoma-amplified sequence 1 n=1 Tax=Dipodomys spectabilis TaxID=105255 RepID=UPI001C536459|nr:breast carcinoma-amplified sequence 1 [Dipodomys spectabilis]